MVLYQCNKCEKTFTKKYIYDNHLKRVKPCTNVPNLSKSEEFNNKRYVCQYCKKQYSRCDSLIRHIKYNCEIAHEYETHKMKNHIKELESKLLSQKEKTTLSISDIDQMIESKLAQRPMITNNLQVLCVGDKDNYLDMLTEKWGDFDRALEYVRNCALSSITGDCKLLGKIYFDPNQFIGDPPIRYDDQKKHKLSFLNEKKERVTDPKGTLLGKRLANNLQNTYLKGINYLIQKKNDKLETYDMQQWNKHIFELSDEQYQRKIVGGLEVPNSRKIESHI